MNNILPEQSRRAKSSDELIKERQELIASYSEMTFLSFNKCYIIHIKNIYIFIYRKLFVYIHKIIFQHLNLFVSKYLCTDAIKKMNLPHLVDLWRTTSQCFFYLLINIRVKVFICKNNHL